jgi:transposase
MPGRSPAQTRHYSKAIRKLAEWLTEHRATIHCCPNCRGRTRATFPEGVASPAQYSERIRAAAVYFNARRLAPEERVAQILEDLFDAAAACGASVATWVGRKAEALKAVYDAIGARVAEAKVRCLDETGLRIRGKLNWLHTTSTLAYTFYRAGEPRSAVPENLQGGVAVHDHWTPDLRLDVEPAFCNAHMLRELAAVIEFDAEPWAEAMHKLLLDANDAVRRAKQAGLSALQPQQTVAFTKRYWSAVRQGLALHRKLAKIAGSPKPRGRQKKRPEHNLLLRIEAYKSESHRFLTDFDAPFTNIPAEQNLRMMKVRMKVSGGFPTPEGADEFARLRSIVPSA